MSVKEKEFGNVTINNEVGMHDGNYTIGYWEGEDYYTLIIPRSKVEREFHARGKARGIVSYYHGDDVNEHELTFEEWEQNIDYRDEFDSFVQELAIEQLNLHAVEALKNEEQRTSYLMEELKEAKDINLRYFAENIAQRTAYEEKLRQADKLLYEATNPNIKKSA